MSVSVFDDTNCALGEGPLWHPERQQFFWFDIIGKKLLTRKDGVTTTQAFDEHVSAAGWVDRDTLLIASETGLYRYDIETGAQSLVVAVEADNPDTRSNDGRADPWGGFWIGTMGKTAQKDAGAIYRYYRGELRCLVSPISITNSICFSPDKRFAYYADTAAQQIIRQPLAQTDGWPQGDAEVFIDFTDGDINPDGSVVDAEGNLWNAQWGAARVAKYTADGKFVAAIKFPAEQTSCPAFGGDGLGDLLMTSAAVGLHGSDQGRTFIVSGAGTGQSEHRVIL